MNTKRAKKSSLTIAVADRTRSALLRDILANIGVEATIADVHGNRPNLAQTVQEVGDLNELTLREREVFGYILLGLSNVEIAKELNILKSTTKWHVHNILHKTQSRGRHELVGCFFLGSGTKDNS